MNPALLLSLAVATSPAGLSDKKVTMELRQADVPQVFSLLGDVGGRPIVADACLTGSKVDVLLHAVPVPLALDVLAAKLNVEYVDEAGKPVVVRCRPGPRPVPKHLAQLANPARDAWLDAHIQIPPMPSASTTSIMKMIARTLGLKDVKLEGPDRTFPLTLGTVRVRTLIEVLKDVAELKVLEVRDDVLYASSPAVPPPSTP